MIISELKVDVVSESNHFQLVFKPQETVDQTMGTSLMNDNCKKLSTWDDLLVRVGRDRDKSAFAELFDYFAPRVKSFLLLFGTDMSLAEEIAQEAMIMVCRRAETYDPRQSAASTWIFTIARNKRIDRLRRENRPLPDMTDPAVMPESIETGEIQVARMQQEKKIRHALKNLPEEQAKMIFSAYYEEKSHREIAEESGVALGTVKSRIRLALNRMRAQIDKDEGITP